MLEDDVIAATKKMVASASESRSYTRSKGKKSCNEQDDNKQDERSKLEAGSLDLSVTRKEGVDPDDCSTENGKLLCPN